ASITVTGTAYLNEQTKISHYVSVKATVIIKPTPSPPPPAAKIDVWYIVGGAIIALIVCAIILFWIRRVGG
ncbi:MAG: hypothetical protein AB1779_08800, partial [Candidatus Thermoplasmatota archaeon]